MLPLTTAQCVIFIIFLILMVYFTVCALRAKEIYQVKDYCLRLGLLCFVLVSFLILKVIDCNKLQSNNKCPDLERLENVYRIKK